MFEALKTPPLWIRFLMKRNVDKSAFQTIELHVPSNKVTRNCSRPLVAVNSYERDSALNRSRLTGIGSELPAPFACLHDNAAGR